MMLSTSFILNICCMVVLVALLAAFIVLLIKKWGIAEYVQVHGNKFFAQMFGCDLCLSWWVGLALTFVCACLLNNLGLLLLPMFTTPLTRYIL